MRITNNTNFQPLQTNKTQKPAFGANIWFENMTKKEIRQHAAGYWAYGNTQTIQNLQTALRKLFTEKGQAGHTVINEIFGKHERVRIGLKDRSHLTLHIEGSESGSKKIDMHELRRTNSGVSNWNFNILDNTKELVYEIRKK